MTDESRHDPTRAEHAAPSTSREARAEAAVAPAHERERRDAAAGRTAEREVRPGAWRRWVLPALRTVLIALIAIALMKLAFFPEGQADAEGGYPPPTAVMEEPLVPVTRGTISNDVTLDGSVMPDAGVPVRATLAGQVTAVHVANGQQVATGAQLYTVRSETEGTPTADGAPSASRVRTVVITAPAAGVLTGFTVLVGQALEVGGETGAVAPPTFHMTSTLTAQQQYRLTTQPTEAEVQITGGPAPFTCTGLQVVQPTPAAPADPSTSEGGQQSSATASVRCAIPADVRVFTGLAGTLTIKAGVAENVLTLPTTAVIGSADTGVVTMLESGTQTEVPVTLGINDGTNVEITGGIDEGTMVMQFAPGAPIDPCADPMTADPMQCGVSGGYAP